MEVNVHTYAQRRRRRCNVGREPGLKPSLRSPGGAEGPHVIGRESGLLRCDWLDHLDRQI